MVEIKLRRIGGNGADDGRKQATSTTADCVCQLTKKEISLRSYPFYAQLPKPFSLLVLTVSPALLKIFYVGAKHSNTVILASTAA